MEFLDCIFCKGTESRHPVVIEENGFLGRKCCSCDLIYISPRPSLTEVLNSYAHKSPSSPYEYYFEWSFSKYLHARHNLLKLKAYRTSGSLLEIGAGLGYFLEQARTAGYEVHGIELNLAKAKYISRRLNVSCETRPLTTAFNDKRFDVVYHCNVLSHLYDPIGEFIEINNRLNPGGILFFETGNIGEIDEKYFSVFSKFQYPDHLFFFGKRSVRRLLEITGFELLSIYTYSTLYQLFFIGLVNNLAKQMRKLLMIFKSNSRVISSETEFLIEKSKKTKKINLHRLLKEIMNVLYHFLCFGLGEILPKTDKPQTMVFVARRIERRQD